MIGPPIFSRLLQSDARTTRHDVVDDEMVTTDFEFGSEDLTHFLLSDVVSTMQGEGFYVNEAKGAREKKIYHMRKESIFIAMMSTAESLHFTSRRDDVTLVNNLVYESILSLQQRVSHIRTVAKPAELRRHLVESASRAVVDWYRYVPIGCINLSMRCRDKDSVIRGLVESIAATGRVTEAVCDSDDSLPGGSVVLSGTALQRRHHVERPARRSARGGFVLRYGMALPEYETTRLNLIPEG